MGYKQPSSGLPFKELGSSPAKQFDIKGYLKGEQGLIPDIGGKSTVETATKVSKNIQEGIKKGVKRHRTFQKIKKSTDALKDIWKGKKPASDTYMKSTNTGASEAVSEKIVLMKREGRGLEPRNLLKESSQEALQGLVQGGKMGLKRTITDETKMKPPYKKPVGPRAE